MKERAANLLQKLRGKKSWKCSCRRFAVGVRTHAESYNNAGHKEKCDLHPGKHEERRWDGKKTGITMEDLECFIKHKAR